jgi:arabinan endo-1,5-alpha-L-arabinosidase
MKVSSIVGGLLLSAGLVAGYSNPESCTGTCTNAHDPSIIRRSDGTYYRFSTGNKIAVHSAPDIVGPWTYLGAAVPDGSTIDLDGNDDLWVSPDYNDP